MRVLAALCLLLACSPAAAQRHRLSAWAGATTWNAPENPFHGALIVAYDLWRANDQHLGLEYNTETLSATYDRIRLGERVELGFGLKGEAFVAGLSRDYWQDGRDDSDRTYLASYVFARSTLKAQVGDHAFFEAEAAGRRWFFGRNAGASDAFRLPANAWVFEPRLRYTWWQLDPDAAWGDRHRPFPRVRGVAAGLEVGVDGRSESRPWGARDPESFEPADPRNDPATTIFRPRQWLLAGLRAHEDIRLQLQEQAAWGVGEDDLTRDRLGALTPYSTPLAGAPWSAWLSERYAAVQGSVHVRAADDFELGPLVTAVALLDPHRTGDRDDGAVHAGVGGLVDWRFGNWQLDLRGGWSPTLQQDADRAAWNLWISAGWATD